MGFCGLDRRREPLAGDEVRACWEDGAAPVAPDPAVPGLLDLLTVGALREPEAAIDDASFVAPDRRERAVPRLRSVNPNRGWVEVDV